MTNETKEYWLREHGLSIESDVEFQCECNKCQHLHSLLMFKKFEDRQRLEKSKKKKEAFREFCKRVANEISSNLKDI